MIDKTNNDDDPLVEMTLELPASLVAQLENIRKQFGEEVLTELIIKAHKTIEGKLALHGAMLSKDRK